MDADAASGLAAFSLILALFGLVLAILWILVPFAVFGIKGRLDRLSAEQRRTNDLVEGYLRQPRY